MSISYKPGNSTEIQQLDRGNIPGVVLNSILSYYLFKGLIHQKEFKEEDFQHDNPLLYSNRTSSHKTRTTRHRSTNHLIF